MKQPSYFEVEGMPEKPKSFGAINNGSDQLRVVLNEDSNVEFYKVLLSEDGLTFSDTLIKTPNNLVLDSLVSEKIYYLKLSTINSVGESDYTEVLAAIPSNNVELSNLIVNGFDRTSEGNTFNFIRQHAEAFHAKEQNFNSATNEAIEDGIIDLNDYSIVDYILGEESTVDETFNDSEKSLVADYLQNGGNLFVSGSEIAWDLDYKGNSADKNFIWNYLKVKYVDDAPFNQSNTYYKIELVQNNYISNLESFSFDNGSQGTYNVNWPDVFSPAADGSGFLKYQELDAPNQFAGIMYDGYFPNGTMPGKVITLGFPFETIYPENSRNNLMSEIVDYFHLISTSDENNSSIPKQFTLKQNYPNPFNPTTTIEFSIPEAGDVSIKIINILGQIVSETFNGYRKEGIHKLLFNASNFASGIYLYTIKFGDKYLSKKMLLLK